nr:hypothetical protein [Tanacetum cinerariifolium]
MDTIIDQHVAIDEALVPHAQRLRIRMSNFCLLSDIKSKESTLQLVYDVLRPRLTTSEKGKQTAKASKAKSLSALSEVAMTEAQQLKLVTKRSLQQTHISQQVVLVQMKELVLYQEFLIDGGDDDDEDGDGEEGDDDDNDQEVERDDKEEGVDEEQEYNKEEYDEETRDEKSFDPIPKTPENGDDEGNGEEDLSLNVGREEGHVEEVEEYELYRDVNINQGRGMESIFESTSQMDVQTPTSVAPLPMTAPTMTPSTTATITTQQAPLPSTTALSTIIQDLPNFGSLFSFDNRLRILEANFSKFMQTNQFARAVSAIPGIVKEQVKVQVSKILPTIEQTVNEQLENEVLTRSSHSLKTSYDVAANLSEMELKKILIKKMEGNKSIQRSDEQRNLYRALVEAYESNKIILDTYEETITLKRQRDGDADKDEEPSAGPDRGSKRRKEGMEPESASALMETAIRSAGRSTQGSRSRQVSASESDIVEEPMQTTFQMEEPSHPEFDTGAEDQLIVQSSQHPEWFSQQQKPPTPDRDWNKTFLLPMEAFNPTHRSIQPWISDLAKQADSHTSFNELMDTPVDFSAFLMNRLKVDTLTPELIAGPTYELMKGSCKSLVEHKDTKKSNEMYYPRFTKVIFHHFMSRDPSIPRNSNAYKEYYAVATGVAPPKPKASVRKTRSSFNTTITPPTAVAGPRLTTSEKGKQAAKASEAKSLSTLSEVPITEAQQLKLATKRSMQQTHISKQVVLNSTDEEGDDDEGKDGDGDDEGNDGDDGEKGDDDDEQDDDDARDDDDEEDEGDDEEDDQEEGGDDEQASNEEDFIHLSLSTHTEEETRDEESFDPIPKTLEDSDDEGNGEENLDINVGRGEGHDEEEEEDELYKDVNINQGRGVQTTQEFEDSHVTLTPVNPDGQQHSSSVLLKFVTSMLNPTPDAGMESIFKTTLQMDVQTPTSVATLPMSAPTLTPSTIATITTT